MLFDISPDFPFLQGRGFVFASQFARLLPLQMAGQYLEAAMHVIESNSAGIPVKISAVKAINKYVMYFVWQAHLIPQQLL